MRDLSAITASPRLVMKFGGTSMGDVERIQRAAEKVREERNRGYDVVVVVSAMSGETNRLLNLATDIAEGSAEPCPAETDAIAAAGEQVSAGLLALALQRLGVPARSWLGWQVAIRTCDAHGAARIRSIDVSRLDRELAAGRVAVVGGFQGVTQQGRIATLGRGGSDTSAVAMAAALLAERCDIYTDVDGVYTTDPRVEAGARRIPQITFAEMLELASQGAKVLQTRSVEIGMRSGTPIQVLSSFQDKIGSDLPGAVVGAEAAMERCMVSGVAFTRDEARIRLTGIDDTTGVSTSVFAALAAIEVSADLLDLRGGADGGAAISFVVPAARLEATVDAIGRALAQWPQVGLATERGLAKISVVGLGLRSHASATETFFQALRDADVVAHQAVSSEIRITALVNEDHVDPATRSLHGAFSLQLGSPEPTGDRAAPRRDAA